ncbi:hypothetical protein C0992_011700 [Termitomyces sp. T32_za158]|nr:hypothetical protein C0992_011700 [Termitomyces sp. T32_za158]
MPPPGSQRDNDARSDGTLCYVDDSALPRSEPASFHRERPPHVDLWRTQGCDAPPPPEPRPPNSGPQRATPGLPPQAPPVGPPRRPPGPSGPAPLLRDQGWPQCPPGPLRPPGQPPVPPSDLDNLGGPPPPPCWNPGPSPGGAGPPGGGSPSGRPPGGGPLGGWGPALGAFLPQQGGNHYYYYYNARPPPRNPGPQDDECDALAREGRLDIQKPESFTSRNPHRWRTYLTQCLNLFQAKPITFQLDSACIAFATSYLQGIAFDHYTTLLRFEPQNPVLSNWQAFVDEFSSKFGVFDTVAEAEDNLFNLKMRPEERFTTFIIRFEKEAYKTSWNYSVL